MGRRSTAGIVNEEEVEKIYALYPKKTDRPAALRAIRNALKKHTFKVIVVGTMETVTALRQQGISKKKTPALWGKVRYPATYFTAENYLDDVEDFPWFNANGTARMTATEGKYDRFD